MAAPKLGILAQVTPTAATDTALYTPSASTRRAVVSTLVITNTSTTQAAAVRIYLRIAGAAAATGNQALSDINIPPGGSQPLTWGIALDGSVGDAISCRSSIAGTNFTVMGNEEDIPSS